MFWIIISLNIKNLILQKSRLKFLEAVWANGSRATQKIIEVNYPRVPRVKASRGTPSAYNDTPAPYAHSVFSTAPAVYIHAPCVYFLYLHKDIIFFYKIVFSIASYIL